MGAAQSGIDWSRLSVCASQSEPDSFGHPIYGQPVEAKDFGAFQSLLASLWPSLRGFLEKEVLQGTVQNLLSNIVRGLRFDSTSLGDRPPDLHAVTCIADRQRLGDQLELVLDVGFHPGSALNVSLALGPLRAGIADLQFRGRLCVRLVGIVSRVPIVSGIKIFFANAPSLGFSLSALGISKLPVAPQKVKELLREAMAKKLVLPHSIDVNLDCLLGKLHEPDFLPYWSLHSIPPVGVLRISVPDVIGPNIFDEAMAQRPGGYLQVGSSTPMLYVLLRVGGQEKRTPPIKYTQNGQRLGWAGQELYFLVDSIVDQDLQIEVLDQDTESLMMNVDEIIYQAKVSIIELAKTWDQEDYGSPKPARVPMELEKEYQIDAAGARRRGMSVFHSQAQDSAFVDLSGSYRPLSLKAADNWQTAMPVLLVTVDCVLGLDQGYHGRRLKVRLVLPRQAKAVEVLASSSTVFRPAAKNRVKDARAACLPFERMRLAQARDRAKLLHDNGGINISPEQFCWLVGPAMCKPEEAARLFEEVRSGRSGEGEAQNAGSCVEVLFEEQLRLQITDPNTQGCRVELLDDEETLVGDIEWSSLAWLATNPNLEDDLEDYPLRIPQRRRAEGAPKLYVKRALMHEEPEVEAMRKMTLGRRPSIVSEAPRRRAR